MAMAIVQMQWAMPRPREAVTAAIQCSIHRRIKRSALASRRVSIYTKYIDIARKLNKTTTKLSKMEKQPNTYKIDMSLKFNKVTTVTIIFYGEIDNKKLKIDTMNVLLISLIYSYIITFKIRFKR